MIAHLLPALERHLTQALAHLRLVAPEKDEKGEEIIRSPYIFIGDFPPKRSAGQTAREFPCVLLLSGDGCMVEGETRQEVICLCCVYNAEDGDGRGAEMDLEVLCSTVAAALRPCMDMPLESRFRLIPDEKNRWLRRQRAGEPAQPRPYVQAAITGLWETPGWE